MSLSDVHIKNKKAYYDFELLDKYVAGLELLGTEIKSLRYGKASISEAYCYFFQSELFVKNMHIAEYEQASFAQHEPRRVRKLLLKKPELRKLERKLKQSGLTIVPTSLFISKRGWAKLEISLAKGKKEYDKRDSIKQKDDKRTMDRAMKDAR